MQMFRSIMAAAGASTPFEITNSGDFEQANSEYLSRTQSGDQRLCTFSWWQYVESTGSTLRMVTGSSGESWLYYGANTWPQLSILDGGGAHAYANDGITAGEWRHIVMHVDTENATAADRLILFIDGVEKTYTSGGGISQNDDSSFNDGSTNYIGSSSSGSQNYDGLLSQLYWISGQKLAPSEFGYNDDTGWTAKAFTGTFGANDSYLTFDDSGTIGADSSGNSNTWTDNNTVGQSATVPPYGVYTAPTAATVTKSGDFETTESDSMSRTQSGDQKTWTFSTWIKFESIGAIQGIFSGSGTEASCYIDASNRITLNVHGGATLTCTNTVSSATWHHIVFRYDTTQGAESDRMRCYLDGVLCTKSSGTYVALDYAISKWFDGNTNYIGRHYTAAYYLDGLMSETYAISGQSLSPYAFAYDNGGTWSPKTYTRDFGANDSYLQFTNTGDLGEDTGSGNSNDWTNSGVATSSTIPPSG